MGELLNNNHQAETYLTQRVGFNWKAMIQLEFIMSNIKTEDQEQYNGQKYLFKSSQV